jgi:hydrogenase-4 membrane subunit HyfE
MNLVRRLLATCTFYSITTLYLAAVAAIILTVQGAVSITAAAAALFALAVLLILAEMHREVRKVHTLVNSQRDLLLARIDQLINTLEAAGVSVPAGKGAVDDN